MPVEYNTLRTVHTYIFKTYTHTHTHIYIYIHTYSRVTKNRTYRHTYNLLLVGIFKTKGRMHVSTCIAFTYRSRLRIAFKNNLQITHSIFQSVQ